LIFLKILFLLTELPYPAYNGVRIKTFNLIKGLSERGHEIHVISYLLNNISRSDIEIMQKYCASVQLYPLPSNRRQLVTNILHGFGSNDVINFRFKSKEFMSAINCSVRDHSFDLVHFDLISLTHYASLVQTKVPIIASINDSYSLWLKNQIFRPPYLTLDALSERAYYTLTFPLARRFEEKILSKFTKIHVVSKIDREYLRNLNNKLDISVIPNGVDTDYYRPQNLPTQENRICFVATMNSENMQNAIWFIRKVFPAVKKQLPNAKFYIVGRGQTRDLLKEALREPGVIVTGPVKDVRPYIHDSSVVIDPTTKTCGILNHVLHSMAMGKAIVGTSQSFLGVEGAISEKHMIIAKNNSDFATDLIYLLRHPSEAKKIGENARLLIETSYKWPAIISKYEKMYIDGRNKFAHDRETRM